MAQQGFPSSQAHTRTCADLPVRPVTADTCVKSLVYGRKRLAGLRHDLIDSSVKRTGSASIQGAFNQYHGKFADQRQIVTHLGQVEMNNVIFGALGLELWQKLFMCAVNSRECTF